MKIIKILLVPTVIILLLICNKINAQNKHEKLFEKAKYTMQTKGDLKSAINLFEEIIKEYPTQKEYGAKSQYYVGLCYQKLGQKEAKKAFERVINNYPGQYEIVSLARERLSSFTKKIKKDKSFRVRQIHDNNPQLGFFGTVSNNGRYLSDVNWSHGNLALFDFNTKEYRDLTNTATWRGESEFCDWSIFSPDDTKIAYYWFVGSKESLRIIDLNELKPKILCEGNEIVSPPWPLCWSYDGKYILAATQDSSQAGKEHDDVHGQLVLVSVKDGSIKVLKDVGKHYCNREDKIQKISANLSKDGKHVAYHKLVGANFEQSDIYIMDLDGEYDVPIVQHPANDFNPYWMPDQKHILFTSDRLGNHSLWIQKIVDRKPIGEPVHIHKLPKDFRTEGLSSDGSFFYGVDHTFTDIYRAKIDLKRFKIVEEPEVLIKKYEGNNISPTISKDGKKLAFILDWAFIGWGIYKEGTLIINNLENGEERRIELSNKIESYDFRSFNWTEDGKGIMFIGTVDKKYGIHILNVLTDELTNVLDHYKPNHIREYIFSANEKSFYLIIGKRNENNRLVKLNLNTGEEKELYNQKTNEHFIGPMVISPDNKKIIVRDGLKVKDKTQVEHIVSISTLTGKVDTLIKKVYKDTQGIMRYPGFTYTPDGKNIIFGKWYDYQDDRIEIFRYSFEKNDIDKLNLNMPWIAKISFHPDRDKIIFQANRVNRGFYKIENIMSRVENAK